VDDRSQNDLNQILNIAQTNSFGVALVARHPELGFGRRRRINLWIRDQSPDWQLSFQLANIDLPLLLALKLIQNWKARLNLITLVKTAADKERAQNYIKDLLLLGRIPRGSCSIHVEQARLSEYLPVAPRADLSFYGMGQRLLKKSCLDMVRQSESTCVFLRDSGRESILV
jgi:hypothetical protein